MWRKWFPWRNIIKSIALKQGFLDPIAVLAKIQRFAQPSEVAAPIELLRLATILQARGLLNVQAIQHNLDWVWPYWVVRQFNPQDVSFIPRAFSITHINLTNRNWTAVGIPDCPDYPIVDPRGLLTPFYDSWSVDAWVLPKDGAAVLPSRASAIKQRWEESKNLVLRTELEKDGVRLITRVFVKHNGTCADCIEEIEVVSDRDARLAVSLRPFNAEGVSEVERIALAANGAGWEVNKKQHVRFDPAPDGQFLSNYKEGDVYQKISRCPPLSETLSLHPEIECRAGMATAAAVFCLSAGVPRKIKVHITRDVKSLTSVPAAEDSADSAERGWESALAGHCRFETDNDAAYVYDAAVKTLVLHTPGTEAFPGPYTYKHFWFRDAVFILHALLVTNLAGRAEKIIDHFPSRQTLTGHYRSQDGEWDSNGQVLWILRRYCQLTGSKPKEAWKDSIRRGARWIEGKRVSENIKADHAGLFPAGFSAEHLGPNDFYYWDDFWGVEGLRSAAALMHAYGEPDLAARYEETAGRFMGCIEESLSRSAARLKTRVMPASPYRRLDTGAVGSLAVGYPLTLWAANDERVIDTVEYLMSRHFIHGGFFHDMSHSGINPYLTLGIAQILLRNGDPRCRDLVRALQKLASPTGQWPEAIHPLTLGGCMGDGQHVWAAAEWILMVRACFVREEHDRVILFSGVLPEWYEGKRGVSFGKTRTPWGLLSVSLKHEKEQILAEWEFDGDAVPEGIESRLPGYLPVTASGGQTSALLTREKNA